MSTGPPAYFGFWDANGALAEMGTLPASDLGGCWRSWLEDNSLIPCLRVLHDILKPVKRSDVAGSFRPPHHQIHNLLHPPAKT